MGQNSTEVAYGFGQFGSAFADTAANTITAPETLAIVAIQFLADTSLSSLVAKDASLFPSTASSAHASGRYTRTVDGATSSATKVIFDEENAGTGSIDEIKVGDELYTTSTGVAISTVTALNPDDDNTKEISIADSSSISDGITVTFLRPNQIDGEGVGGQTLATAQVFPKGLTIYGRWDSVSLNADDTDGGIICYFGK
jgi:glutamate mutase epsilon subunit